MPNLFKRLALALSLAGLLAMSGCAHTDLAQAGKACADQAIKAAAKEVLPDLAKSITCVETTDAGIEACAETSLGSLAKTLAPEVFSCAMAMIHDQTIK